MANQQFEPELLTNPPDPEDLLYTIYGKFIDLSVVKNMRCIEQVTSAVRIIRRHNIFNLKSAKSTVNGTITFIEYKIDGDDKIYFGLEMSTALALKAADLHIGPAIEYRMSDLRGAQRAISMRTVYKVKDLCTISNACVRNKLRYTIKNEGGIFNLNIFLAYTIRLEGLMYAVGDYLLLPDSQVSVQPMTIDSGVAPEGETAQDKLRREAIAKEIFISNLYGTSDASSRTQPEYSEEDLSFIAVALILSMSKNYFSTEQVALYLEARCKAFANQMKYEFLTYSHVSPFIILDDFRSLSERLEFYPILKSTLYRYILGSKEPWAQYVSVILKDAQLSAFNFIHVMLTKLKPKKVFLMGKVSDQIKKYIKVHQACLTKYGEDLLPYAKLIDPTNNEMANSNWQELAALAVYAVYLDSRSESLKRFISKVKVGYEFKRAMAIEISDAYCSAYQFKLVPPSDEMYDFIGISRDFSVEAENAFTAENQDILACMATFDNMVQLEEQRRTRLQQYSNLLTSSHYNLLKMTLESRGKALQMLLQPSLTESDKEAIHFWKMVYEVLSLMQKHYKGKNTINISKSVNLSPADTESFVTSLVVVDLIVQTLLINNTFLKKSFGIGEVNLDISTLKDDNLELLFTKIFGLTPDQVNILRGVWDVQTNSLQLPLLKKKGEAYCRKVGVLDIFNHGGPVRYLSYINRLSKIESLYKIDLLLINEFIEQTEIKLLEDQKAACQVPQSDSPSNSTIVEEDGKIDSSDKKASEHHQVRTGTKPKVLEFQDPALPLIPPTNPITTPKTPQPDRQTGGSDNEHTHRLRPEVSFANIDDAPACSAAQCVPGIPPQFLSECMKTNLRMFNKEYLELLYKTHLMTAGTGSVELFVRYVNNTVVQSIIGTHTLDEATINQMVYNTKMVNNLNTTLTSINTNVTKILEEKTTIPSVINNILTTTNAIKDFLSGAPHNNKYRMDDLTSGTVPSKEQEALLVSAPKPPPPNVIQTRRGITMDVDELVELFR